MDAGGCSGCGCNVDLTNAGGRGDPVTTAVAPTLVTEAAAIATSMTPTLAAAAATVVVAVAPTLTAATLAAVLELAKKVSAKTSSSRGSNL